MRNYLFWKTLWVVYCLFVILTTLVLAIVSIFAPIELASYIVSMVNAVALFGLAYNKHLWDRRIWIGLLAVNGVLLFQKLKLFWVPAIQSGMQEPELVIGIFASALNGLILYGLFLYTFRSPWLWNKAMHSDDATGIENTGAPSDAGAVH